MSPMHVGELEYVNHNPRYRLKICLVSCFILIICAVVFLSNICHYQTHTDVSSNFPIQFGRRDCPQTRERSPLGAVTMVPPGGWSLVDNKRNTQGNVVTSGFLPSVSGSTKCSPLGYVPGSL